MNNEKFSKLEEYSKAIVNRYVKFYYGHFRKNGYDYDDLIQEARIVLWKILEKYKDKPDNELKKIVSSAVGRHMIRLKKQNKIKFEELDDSIKEENEEDVEYVVNMVEFNDNELIKDKRTTFQEPEINIKELIYKLLDKAEFKTKFDWDNKRNLYAMLYRKYVLNETFEDIGRKYCFTRQRANSIIRKALKLLRKYF